MLLSWLWKCKEIMCTKPLEQSWTKGSVCTDFAFVCLPGNWYWLVCIFKMQELTVSCFFVLKRAASSAYLGELSQFTDIKAPRMLPGTSWVPSKHYYYPFMMWASPYFSAKWVASGRLPSTCCYHHFTNKGTKTQRLSLRLTCYTRPTM